MANVIYQPVSGRLRIGNRDYPLGELVMDYYHSNQGDYLITIKDRILGTVIENVPLSEIEDNVSGTYASISDWTAWWESLKTPVDDLKNEQFPEAIYILVGTGAATTGAYLGFYAIEADTAIDSITGIDTGLVKGDNDFSEVTFQPGIFVRVPGGFNTMTLSAGAMVLVIDNS